MLVKKPPLQSLPINRILERRFAFQDLRFFDFEFRKVFVPAKVAF